MIESNCEFRIQRQLAHNYRVRRQGDGLSRVLFNAVLENAVRIFLIDANGTILMERDNICNMLW